MSEEEVWKLINVVPFGERYEISTLGRVRSLYVNSTTSLLRRAPRLKRPHHAKLFTQINLSYNGIQKTFLLHHLVLLTFVGPRPAGMEGSHKDGDFTNNCVANLCWETHTENEARKFTHGTRPVGSQCPWAKLTAEQVWNFRVRYKNGERPSVLCREANVGSGGFHHMLTGKTWRHVPMP